VPSGFFTFSATPTTIKEISMELSNFSVAELRDLQEKVAQEIKHRGKKDVEAARNEIYAIAHRMGLPLKDLIGNGSLAKTGSVAIKYRNPENPSEQWTGRGRQPTWIKQAVESGKNLDYFKV
jgi:DNA-binding protein H-NS